MEWVYTLTDGDGCTLFQHNYTLPMTYSEGDSLKTNKPSAWLCYRAHTYSPQLALIAHILGLRRFARSIFSNVKSLSKSTEKEALSY